MMPAAQRIDWVLDLCNAGRISFDQMAKVIRNIMAKESGASSGEQPKAIKVESKSPATEAP